MPIDEILRNSISGLFAIAGIGVSYLFAIFTQERQEKASLKGKFAQIKSDNILKRIDDVRVLVFEILINSDPDARSNWDYQKLLQSKLKLELHLNNQNQTEVSLNYAASMVAIAVRDNAEDGELFRKQNALTDSFTKYRLDMQERIIEEHK